MSDPLAPLDPPRRLLMGSGPSNPEPRVLQMLTAPPLAADDPALGEVREGVAALGRAVFQAPADSDLLVVPGASRAGIEAVLATLIEPNQTVLVGAFGHFGELLVTLATRHGAHVARADAAWGEALDQGALAARVRAERPGLLAVVHADTSTGICQPLDALGEACRAAGTLLVVDTVLSLGGCEVDVAGWGIDAAIGGLQKCLGGPPGLALVSWSARAAAVRAARRSPPRSSYLDLACRAADGTTSAPMLYGAYEALRLVVAEGLPARWARHQRASRALRAGLRALGLELFAAPAARVPMITLVRVPPGIDDARVRADLLAVHGIEIMAAFGPLLGQVWRIGTMGTNARGVSVLAVLAALEAVLAAHGWAVPRGAAVDAALAAGGADALADGG